MARNQRASGNGAPARAHSLSESDAQAHREAYAIGSCPVAEWKGLIENSGQPEKVREILRAVHAARKYWESLDNDGAVRTIALNVTDKRL